MKEKTLKLYWSLFCVILAVFMTMVAVYVAFPTKANDSDRIAPVMDCKIVLSQGDKFEAESYIMTVKRGEDATFALTFDEGYIFNGCDYENYELLSGENSSFLMLKNVLYPTSVEVYTKEIPPMIDEPDKPVKPDEPIEPDKPVVPELPVVPANAAAVIYHLNGGTMYENNDVSWYSITYSIGIYPRINADRAAEKIGREGYVLIGWNTEADGSGTHIGLGSRLSVFEGETMQLYAQWSQWSDVDYFEYVLVDTEDISCLYLGAETKKTLEQLVAESDSKNRSAMITLYTGMDEEKVTIPEILDGYSVAGINKRSFSNNEVITTVILPKSIKWIDGAAFSRCDNLVEVFIYDNLESCEDASFGYARTVSTLHINAINPPTYSDSEISQFANKMEMLINNTENKSKLIFFGGCSILYGLDCAQIDESFEDKYSVFNMGVIGGTCAIFQLDMIYQYVNQDDILVHIPELSSMMQLFCDVSFDSRAFSNLESNYDLLARLDIRNYDNVFGSFNDYLVAKQMLLSIGDYTDAEYIQKLEYINEYGDIITEREGGFDNEGESYQFLTQEVFEESNAAAKMKEYYDMFMQKGLDIYFGYAPINSDGLDLTAGTAFCEFIENSIYDNDIPAKVIMQLSDVIMDRGSFYDENYHLSSMGAQEYTNFLINRLFKYINEQS